jgi:hypothetical protein
MSALPPKADIAECREHVRFGASPLFAGDIRWRPRYEDITRVSPQGRWLLDYTKFHDTVPE